MSEKNHIDELFQSKLGGREVAYSASAWTGAEQMLDKHFRWMAIKKWLMILVPLVLISGGGLIWMLQDGETGVANAPTTIEKVNPASVLPAPENNTSNAVSVVEEPQHEDVTAVADVEATEENATAETIEATSTVEANAAYTASVEPPSSANAIQEETLAESMPVATKSVQEEEEFDWNSPAFQPAEYVNELENKKPAFLGMPVFSVGKVSLDCYNDPAETSMDIPAPVLNELRKVQVVGDVAVVGAQGFLNQAQSRKPIVPGAYLGLGLEYHQNQTLMYRLDASAMIRSGLAANDTIGMGSDIVTIQPLTATYLNLAASVGYKIGARHTIRGGMQFGTLAHVLVREKQGLPGDASGETSFMNDKTGFSSLDFAPFLGYEMAVAPRLDVSAILFYGIPDMTESLGGRYPAEDPNHYVKLGVLYRLR